MKYLHFKRIIITAIIVFILIIATVNLTIIGYAFYLGFQAQGTPNSQTISAFAVQYALRITVISGILFSFFAGIWTARNVNQKVILHSLVIASVVAVLVIINGIIFSQSLWHDFLAGLAMLLFSYLGAKIWIVINNSFSQPNST